MWWGHGGWGAGGWVAMALMMLLFAGLVAALLVWVVSSASKSTAAQGTLESKLPSPDSVLADRFARGEIDEDEFTRRRDALHGTRGGPRGSPDQ